MEWNNLCTVEDIFITIHKQVEKEIDFESPQLLSVISLQ